MKKLVVYEIEFCNSSCPYFCHCFEDFENIWCSRLNQKVYDYDEGDVFFDHISRPIPENCPLESSK